MFKRIVVAIDGSRTSRRAFESGLELAATHGAVLTTVWSSATSMLTRPIPSIARRALRKGSGEADSGGGGEAD